VEGDFEREVAEEVTFETRRDVVGEEEEFWSLEQRKEGVEKGESSRGSEVVESRKNRGDGGFFCGSRRDQKERRESDVCMYACMRLEREDLKAAWCL